ncbi:MAG: 1-acyl-sn-glycerol-3-phosphate acyltransferase [Bdellovibrionota bacterium]
MQDILLNKPYEFVPPKTGDFWCRVFDFLLPTYLRKTFGIQKVECRGVEHLRDSLKAGRGVLLTPNHCRPSDPMLLGMLARDAQCHLFIMASAHLFYQGRFQRWLLPNLGAFSIYREGLDRAALDMAMQILQEGRRPLVLFPEGVVSRANDRLGSLMDGISTIVRGAAKRRLAANQQSGIAVHPVAIRYFYHGNVADAVAPVLTEIEQRLTWLKTDHLTLKERLEKIGRALLCLKEVELFDAPQQGSIPERIERLVDASLAPLEVEWLKGKQTGGVVARVKKLRAAILPDVIKGELDEKERERRWRQLTLLYYTQAISFYPPDYVTDDSPPEHILETVERFEEDLTDVARVYSPMSAVIEVAPPLVVGTSPDEPKKGTDIMPYVDTHLRRMMEELKDRRPNISA